MKEIENIRSSEHGLRKTFFFLKKSSFVRNILVVMTGTALAQAIGFALTPIISRLFSPADFGIFGSFNAVYSVIAAGATMQYSQAIMLPKEKGNAINLLAVSFFCTGAVGVICLMFCVITPATVNGLMKIDGVWPCVALVIAVIMAGVNQTCQAWAVRVKAFKQTSASQVIRSTASNGLKIGFGFLYGGAPSLIICNILADFLASINLFRVLFPDILLLRKQIRLDLIKQLSKEYRDFPMYSASQNVINALSSGLPVSYPLLRNLGCRGLCVWSKCSTSAYGLYFNRTKTSALSKSLRKSTPREKPGDSIYQDDHGFIRHGHFAFIDINHLGSANFHLDIRGSVAYGRRFGQEFSDLVGHRFLQFAGGSFCEDY
jgi:hypothetical protein